MDQPLGSSFRLSMGALRVKFGSMNLVCESGFGQKVYLFNVSKARCVVKELLGGEINTIHI